MNSLGSRVAEARRAAGISQEKLAAKINRAGKTRITKQALSKIENNFTKNPGGKTIEGIADALNISGRYLLTGKEEPSVRASDMRITDTYPTYKKPPSGYVRVPVLAMEGSMGDGYESDAPLEIIDYLEVKESWALLNLPRPYDRVKIIIGRGNSNAPLINDGDLVFVDTSINSFIGEDIYVFNWNGKALIKRLAVNLKTNTLRIISANPDWVPIEFTMNEFEQLHIAGRVVAWYSLHRN
ncbi:XRE family transcriptional regulator [Xylella fastidiosa]|uniref:XRE family transcriptional regulator n=1 Tax=Xylella fastidiosa TaxID=2371 RepID=UPI000765B36D|nr:LexA family transcriptional regulator [Xylella fastidiosa]KXB11357.1 hypothetical protein ADT29_12050 [Xylella fastidiosa]KXB19733.1 hypothetical protein ADT28_09460 [Xylella fastidiosa]